MRIHSTGNVRRCMSQMLADCIEVFTCQNEQGCVCVPQSVNRDFAQFRVSADEAAELGV